MELYDVPEWAKVFEVLHDEQMNHFWRPPLLEKFVRDIADWKTMSEGVKRKIKTVVRVFTLMEVEVIDGIGSIGGHELPRMMKIMLGMQEAMEGIHTRSYDIIDNVLEFDGPLLDDLISGRMELLKWNKDRELSLAEKLVHLTFSEGIGFNTLFSIFFLLETKGLLIQTCTVNKEVQTDENLHTKSAAATYKVLVSQGIIERLSTDEVYAIASLYVSVDDVASECLFSDNDPFFLTMSVDNSKVLTRNTANSIVKSLGYPYLYPKRDNPYKFVDQSLVNTLEFFFDKEVVAYGLDAENDYTSESEDDECYL